VVSTQSTTRYRSKVFFFFFFFDSLLRVYYKPVSWATENKRTMYSLSGNRQGAEEGQDESRALVDAFPGEGALKGKPDNPVRLQEQQHNKQTGLW
jgi:hypothetical protein